MISTFKGYLESSGFEHETEESKKSGQLNSDIDSGSLKMK
jgi:hypothetical protein